MPFILTSEKISDIKADIMAVASSTKYEQRLDGKTVKYVECPKAVSSMEESRRLLIEAYMNTMEEAEKEGAETIAFSLFGDSVKSGYSTPLAKEVALEAFAKYSKASDLTIYLSMPDGKSGCGAEFNIALNYYIKKNLREPVLVMRESICNYASKASAKADADMCFEGYDFAAEIPKIEPSETFSDMLMRLIDEKGIKDSEAYRRSNIDRRLFSKIRSNRDYTPTKKTVFAFIIGLGLDIDTADTLLMKAGYAFSDASKMDLIIQYCVENGRYDIFEINALLFDYGLETLGV